MGTKQTIRLNKFIADSGVASRRKADTLISQGQVMVNGKKVFELGTKVDPTSDRVTVEGHPIQAADEKVYLMLFKPRQVLTTLKDPEGRPTIADFIDDIPYRIFPVGRMDWDSEGLVLLTNDGDYANKVMNPKEELLKTYLVKVHGNPTNEDVEKLRAGISVIGGKATVRKIDRIRRGDSKDKSWFKISIDKEKTDHLRKMFEKIRYDVEKIQRISIGALELGSLKRGEYALLTRKKADLVFVDPLRNDDNKIKRKKSAKRYFERT